MASPSKSLEVIVLAAGKGTRMRSHLPKVLHQIGGRPLLAHVLDTAHALEAGRVHVVYGHGGEQVPTVINDSSVNWVLQEQQHGTGHAVAQAMPGVDPAALVLVLYGDVPLIRSKTLHQLVERAEAGALALLTMELSDAGAYGRIVRDAQGNITSIVEKKDADSEQLAIREINTGFLAAPAEKLRHWLSRLSNDNAQGEYYLTDIVAMAVDEGYSVVSENPAKVTEIEGINSKAELARMERTYQSEQTDALMEQGLTLRDPARFDLRGELSIGRDVVIDVNVIVEGKVELGDNVHIGPNTLLRDVVVGADSEVLANCVLEQANVGKGCRIGPFARLRPGAALADNVHVGNFVEIKNSEIGEGSKVNHLAYVGDSKVGTNVNVGAGAITANYDGANKHQTVIEDGASVGANSVMVAPVAIGKNATLAAGTILRKDAPAGELTLSAGKQRSIKGWKRPTKNK
ncbi:MAG: bifunctional UDP-N-acetylglucosamine diphosphorylase/glucosamine-1-phosphate N-acetyltransferase GlmU [Acidiferrobacterales bacterium]|nr:bifunctional UDP-N-acetylglucosamine diphosphorylase/glucosamine-1-phosphate N-acetyltransferase GlmU [Acidiferrobacterales bacterium]